MKAPKTIDTMLFILERQADTIGHNLDNNAVYIKVCRILTDMDFDEPVTVEDKTFVRDSLRDMLFPAMGLDYDTILRGLLAQQERGE